MVTVTSVPSLILYVNVYGAEPSLPVPVYVNLMIGLALPAHTVVILVVMVAAWPLA